MCLVVLNMAVHVRVFLLLNFISYICSIYVIHYARERVELSRLIIKQQPGIKVRKKNGKKVKVKEIKEEKVREREKGIKIIREMYSQFLLPFSSLLFENLPPAVEGGGSKNR